MATLLQFESARRRSAPRGGAIEGPAKILFFTGIRYERQPEPTAKKQGSRKHAKLGVQRAPRKLLADAKR